MSLISRVSFTYVSRISWAMFAIVFLLAGVVGHDPWKQDETYSFGIIYHFYTTHSWLIPTNAGVPFMEKPPLYYWTAVLFCKVLGGLMPLHSAARLTSFFYMLVTTGFAWKLGQVLFRHRPQGEEMSWMVPALLLSSLGLMRHAHDMFTDVALLAGAVITLYGMALYIGQESGKRAALWLGLGIGIAFMSKGLFVPIVFAASCLMLPLIMPELRTFRTLKIAFFACVVASPFLCIWPIMLYDYSPPLFREWFWDNNVGRFIGFSVAHLGAGNDHYYFLHAPWWFAFPVFPLACITAIHNRHAWRRPEYLLPCLVSAAGLVSLLISASARALYLLPFFPAFALLAVQALYVLPTRFLGMWNKIVQVVFSAAIFSAWGVWIILMHPDFGRSLPLRFHLIWNWLPLGFIPPSNQWLAVICALAATLFWLMSFRLSARNAYHTVLVWFAAVAAIWIMVNSLLLPWIDETKSYRPVIAEVDDVLKEKYKNACVGTFNLGESVAPMFEYFHRGNASFSQDFNGSRCPVLLLLTEKSAAEPMDSRWKLIWRGSRLLDTKDEELRLYSHQ